MSLSIDVSTSALHAVDALGQNSAVAHRVVATLEKDGVAAADIQTEAVTLDPRYDSGSVVTGYQVDDSVTATAHDLGRAGSLIDDAVAAAGDAGRLGGVSFSIDQTSPLLAQARAQAVASARAQAQQLASAAGVKLGSLLSLSDTSNQVPAPVRYGYATSAGAPAAMNTPVQPGTQQLSVQVSAVWAIG
jgi:hypothetical protein